MTATATPAKQTWRDMMPPDAPEPPRLLSRDELIAELGNRGIEVKESDLRYWQLQRMLPYAEKERIGKASHTRYAPWMIGAIEELVRLRDEGVKRGQIRAEMPRIIANVARGDPAHRVDAIGIARAGAVTLTGMPASGIGGGSGSLTIIPAVFRTLANDLARAYTDRNGIPIKQVDIRLIDDRGNPVSATFRTDE